MGSCEHFGELSFASPSVVVASEPEGLVSEEPSFSSSSVVVASEPEGFVSEVPSFASRSVVVASEPEGFVSEELSFASRSVVGASEPEGLMSEGVVGVNVVASVCEMDCSLESGDGLDTLGVGDGNLANDCVVSVDGVSSSQMVVEKASLECGGGDGTEVVVSDSLGEGLQELVMEPLSSLNIGSRGRGDVEDSVVLSASGQDRRLGLGNHISAPGEQDVGCMDGCLNAATVERNAEQINERPGIKFGASVDNLELENVSSIECRFNTVFFDGTFENSETYTFISNSIADDQVPSGRLQVAGVSNGSAALTKDCNNQVAESLMEAVSDSKHAGAVDAVSFKSLVLSDKSRTDCDGNENDRTDDDTCQLNFFDAPLSLRRSSRSRKIVHQVQRGKNVLKCSQKAANLPLSRTMDVLAEARRKKRSCLSRSVSSSVWGLSENLSKYFQWSEELTVNQVLIEGTTKRKAGQRSRRKNTTKKAARSQSSEQSQGPQCRPIRLKVTFGKTEEHNKVGDMPIVGQLGLDILTGTRPGNIESQPHLVSYMESKSGNVTSELDPEEMLKLVECSSSISNGPIKGTNLDTSSVSCKSSLTCADSFQLESEKLDNLYGDKFLDPGTSPDSEVIDQVLDSNDGPTALLHDSISRPLVCPNSPKLSKNRKNNNNKVRQRGKPGIVHQRKPCEVKELTDDQSQMNNDFVCVANNAPLEIPLSNTSGRELVPAELFSVAGDISHKASCLDNGADSNSSSRMIGVIESADSGNSSQLFPPSAIQGKKNTKGLQSKGKPKSKSKITNTKRNKKEASGQLRGNKNKSSSKCKMGETVILDEAHPDRSQPGTGNEGVVRVGETYNSYTVAPQTISCLALPSSEVGEQILPPRLAWVCCDECGKWRCIPAELADAIEATNSKWFCKENQDWAFADCSIPQEKSNAEINAELQISDEEDARDGQLGSKGGGIRQPGESQQSTWMLIKSNLFLHRSRKTQTVDEIMVCHCKPPAVGTMGCGRQCLNRILNIECVQGTCPSGDLCSNQQFQKKQYAKLSWFRCGKKGYGLQVLEDVSQGKFLIEYVGEVLDLQSYEARQKEYASQGHKHFYFMTLNGNEVIDACAKGNVGRFVNHSCDPNCRTEKWVVNGEICVGLFASRNIKKGEELTFDYNYVRVFGAAAKKCYCGSPKCRGYIGGDPLNTEVTVQGDSDEEFPEPVVVDENGDIDHTLDIVKVRSSSEDISQVLEEVDLPEEKLEVIPEVEVMVSRSKEPIEVCKQPESLIEQVAVDVRGSSERLEVLETENERIKPVSTVQLLKPENPLSTSTSSKSNVYLVKGAVHKSLSSSIDSSNRMSEVDSAEGEGPHVEACPQMKISRPYKSVKNRRSNSNAISIENASLMSQFQRSQVSPCKPKKQMEGPANSHLETVEGKLNDLLDAEGGICRKKDSSKGYLKLLLLTAASGDSCNGGAIQSNRELSMILDAILKTKSRGVLVDIINKNGLQMLHNMMKLYRKDFKKIPILRKLLKVLEFLAEREILSVERIIEDSLRPGVETFRQSILNLAEHDDKKVHQIARNFRDRWIPRPIRRYNGIENSDWKRDFSRRSNSNSYPGTYNHCREHGARMPEAVNCVKQLSALDNPADAVMQEASHLTDTQTVVSRVRKRKSRWDQLADSVSPRRSKELKIETSSPEKIKTSPVANGSEAVERLASEARKRGRDCNSTDDVMQSSEDDAPPGFSCLQNTEIPPPGFSSLLEQKVGSLEPHSVVSTGLLQERFNPWLPVAYGIPVSVIQQYGTLKPGTVDSWAVAPAFPFQPFPPLPPYPRDKRACLQARLGESNMTNSSSGEERQENHDAQGGQSMPSTSGASLPHEQNSGTANQTMLHHERGSWNGPGRRFYRQKRWNNHMPPWFRNKDGWAFKGNHLRNRVSDKNMQPIAHEQNGLRLADVNHSVNCAGDSC